MIPILAFSRKVIVTSEVTVTSMSNPPGGKITLKTGY